MMTGFGVIDHQALDALREMTGDDDVFLAEMIDAYVEDTERLLATLEESLTQEEAGEVQRAAHSMKSNSKSFGASTLAELCSDMEARGRNSELDAAWALLSSIRAEYTLVQAELLAIRPGV